MFIVEIYEEARKTKEKVSAVQADVSVYETHVKLRSVGGKGKCRNMTRLHHSVTNRKESKKDLIDSRMQQNYINSKTVSCWLRATGHGSDRES